MSLPGAACPCCRYSLDGLAAGAVVPDRCPECGGGLAPGLVAGTGPTRMRRLMLLMFAWLAFAGCMNATRRGFLVFDWLDRSAVVASGGRATGQGGSVRVIAGQVQIFGVGATPAPVPETWWLELGAWSILGIVGIGGIVGVALLGAGSVAREKRLVSLLVLGFIAYWGYHGFQFALEVFERL